MLVLDGRVVVDYGSAVFDSGVGSDDVTNNFTGQSNGLCDASTPGVLRLMTASHSGEVRFTVDLFDAAPEVPTDYEDIVEVSFVPADPRCALQGFWGDELGAVELTEGEYRIRYCGRNLDQAHAHEIDAEYDEYVALDEYLLQIWPAPAAPDRVVREVSEFARVRNADRPTQADAAVFSTPERHRSRIYGLQWLLSLGAVRVGLDDDPVFVRGLDDALRVCDAAIRRDKAAPGEKVPSVGKTRRSAARRIQEAWNAAGGAASSVPLKGQMQDPAWLNAQAWWALSDLITAASDPEDSNTYDLALIHCRNLLDDEWRTIEPESVLLQDQHKAPAPDETQADDRCVLCGRVTMRRIPAPLAAVFIGNQYPSVMLPRIPMCLDCIWQRDETQNFWAPVGYCFDYTSFTAHYGRIGERCPAHEREYEPLPRH